MKNFSDEMLRHAKANRIQDISILPAGEKNVILLTKSHYRKVYQHISDHKAQQLITRFKYLGEMDVGERRKAQLGAIDYPLEQEIQRLRVSSVGDFKGRESLVLRFLYPLDCQQMHYFLPEQIALITCCTQPRGLYLFSGPTGSGKTTLMYQLALQEKGQVITIEDPVEIEEPTFLQLQTNDKIKQSYDTLIRLSLRHRPSLLIIGEIRDTKTAHAAIRAALTGHRVFATVHAKGLMETIARLKELLPEKNELSDALMGTIYTRLLPSSTGRIKGLFAYHFYGVKEQHLSWEEAKIKAIKQGELDETQA